MCGVEYFGHPWEFGPRRAKELLLTGDSLDAGEAYRFGMVSKVFPESDLDDGALAFARRIATRQCCWPTSEPRSSRSNARRRG